MHLLTKAIASISLLICTTAASLAQPAHLTPVLSDTYQDHTHRTPRLVDSLLTAYPDLPTESRMAILRYKALAHRKLGNYVKAIGTWDTLYHYAAAKPDSLLLAEAGDQIGTMNTFMGNLLAGQRYYLEVAAIYDKVGSQQDKADIKNGLAILYYDLNQYDKAIATYQDALVDYEQLDDTMGRANVHANLGMLYTDIGRYDEAEPHLLMQGHLDSLLGTQWGLGFHFDFLGTLRHKQGRLQEALEAFQTAYTIRQDLPSHYNLAESRNSLAGIHIKLGNYDQAIQHAESVLSHKADHQSLSQESTAYYNLSQAHEGLGHTRIALDHYKKYHEVSDSIYQRDHLSEIAEKDALYEKAKQDKALAELATQNAITSAKVTSRTRALWIVGIGCLILLGILHLLRKLLIKIREQKQQLEQALAQKDILLREIHHRVKNNLQLVSSLLSLQGRTLSDATALEAINEGRSRVRSMALIHQDLYNKKNLTGIGIKTYLEKLTNELLHTYHIGQEDIRLDLDIQDIDLDIDTIVPLGLIINELITNSLKYAFLPDKQGQLSIALHEKEDGLHLRVADDGKGMESSELRPGSFGTTMIKALSSQLGGTIHINGEAGTETSFVFTDYKVA